MTHILLIGSGAVGAFYASRLPSAQVSVVCRSNYHSVLRQKGFRVESKSFENYEFRPFAIYPSIQAAHEGAVAQDFTYEYILIATKALPEISDNSFELIPFYQEGAYPTLVLIQNGLGIEKPFAVKFPHSCILSAVTAVSSAQTEPGLIVHYRWTRIHLGPFPTLVTEEQGIEKAKILASLFHQGGVKDAKVHSSQELQMLRWHKIAINAAFSPSAILSGGHGNAELVLDPLGREHIRTCMQEVFDVAQKIFKQAFPSDFASIEQIINSTEKNIGSKPSMLLDWEYGRPLELQVILGNPIAEARAHGLQLPRLESMYALLSMSLASRQKSLIKSSLLPNL